MFDWIKKLLPLLFVLMFLGLAGCASKGRVEYANIGTVNHPLLSAKLTWEGSVECGPFEKFLDAIDAWWKATLPTPALDAEAIVNAATTAAVKAVREADMRRVEVVTGGGDG